MILAGEKSWRKPHLSRGAKGGAFDLGFFLQKSRSVVCTHFCFVCAGCCVEWDDEVILERRAFHSLQSPATLTRPVSIEPASPRRTGANRTAGTRFAGERATLEDRRGNSRRRSMRNPASCTSSPEKFGSSDRSTPQNQSLSSCCCRNCRVCSSFVIARSNVEARKYTGKVQALRVNTALTRTQYFPF